MEGNKEPLCSSLSIGEQLGSKEDMLIVLVPWPILARLDTRLNGVVCADPFYNEIVHALLNARIGFILIKSFIPRSKLKKKLYIRESYTSIVSSIMHVATSKIINGGESSR